MTISITWHEAQDLIGDECALALGWSRDQITWDTEAEVVQDDLIRLGLVSSIEPRDPGVELDAELIETRTYATQGNVQIRAETSEPGESITICGTLRRWFQRGQVQARLAEEGLAILGNPGPRQAVPVNFDGYWISISQFELTFHFNTCETDDEAYLIEALRVTGSGTIGGVPAAIDVTKP